MKGLAPRVRDGLQVVVPGPTCSYQLKQEFPELLDSDDARLVAENTLDLGEYVFKVAAAKQLDREFKRRMGRVAYHLPCHLKAQNIGFRSKQILGLVADEVLMVDACSGVDGTWGMKARYYDESLKICGDLMAAIDQADPDHVATDCPLSALRIQERTGREAVHPVVLLRDAYGFGDEVMRKFIDSGWEFGAGADAAAQGSEVGGAVGSAGTFNEGMTVYQLTEAGLVAQASVAGTKYWKDKELNSGE